MEKEVQTEILRKRRKGLLKAFLALALVSTGIFYYWLQSPTYAVLELEKSIKDRDLATFYSRLDLNRIYDSSLDAGAALETAGESPWETFQANMGTGVTKLLKSQVMNAVKHDIELQFRRDPNVPVEARASTAASISLLREFFEDSRSLIFGKLARSEEMALVNVDVQLKKMGKSYPLTLKLEKLGDWKVTGFEGLASSLSLYEKDRVIRINEHNLSVEKEFRSLVPFFGQIREEAKLLDLGQDLKFEILFHNKGTSPLEQIEGVLILQNAKAETVLKEIFSRSDLKLGVNEKKVFLLSKDIGVLGDKVSFADGLTLQFQVDNIRFEDGKTLVMVKSYEQL